MESIAVRKRARLWQLWGIRGNWFLVLWDTQWSSASMHTLRPLQNYLIHIYGWKFATYYDLNILKSSNKRVNGIGSEGGVAIFLCQRLKYRCSQMGRRKDSIAGRTSWRAIVSQMWNSLYPTPCSVVLLNANIVRAGLKDKYLTTRTE